MKVFFTASQKGKSYFEQYYKRIVEETEIMGFLILKDDIIDTKEEEYYHRLKNGGKEEYNKLYHDKLKALQEADVCVFEATVPSFSVGYLIAKSLEFNKPTIVLYFKDNVPYFLLGISNEKLIARNYNDSNLNKILEEAYKAASQLQDKRFNFFITPDLLNYLDETSRSNNVTKSMFIRKLILDHRQKNRTS